MVRPKRSLSSKILACHFNLSYAVQFSPKTDLVKCPNRAEFFLHLCAQAKLFQKAEKYLAIPIQLHKKQKCQSRPVQECLGLSQLFSWTVEPRLGYGCSIIRGYDLTMVTQVIMPSTKEMCIFSKLTFTQVIHSRIEPHINTIRVFPKVQSFTM